MQSTKFHSQAGFSLAELLIVVALSVTMTSVSLYYLYSHQKLYKPDEQAALFIDMLQEARQRALTQKATMRVELDLTDNTARLINEGSATVATDDVVIRQFTLKAAQEVVVEQRPNNVTVNPVEPSPVDPITFNTNSQHPLSSGHKVATLRFRRDGSVHNAGTNALGAGSTVTGATVFVWQPDKPNANNATITRAITVIGTTGAIRLWNYYPNLPANTAWKDSRRFQ
jgi:Tfp pilus assembly protein FimT